jgi:hypothetical protein
LIDRHPPVIFAALLIESFGIWLNGCVMKDSFMTFRTLEIFGIFEILGHFFPTCGAVHGQSPFHDIILRMPPETEEEPKKGGQFLGCAFAFLAVGAILFALMLFLRACS